MEASSPHDEEFSSSFFEAVEAAVAAAVAGEAFDAPAARSSSSRRALRLAATRSALVLDVLAVVAGVRSGAMLDYCPGLEPGAAASLAAAASEAFSEKAFSERASAPEGGRASSRSRAAASSPVVVAARLDGCCYLLNSRLLGRAPPSPPPPPPPAPSTKAGGASAAGAFSGTAPWPIVFRGSPPAPRWGASGSDGEQLAASLAPLAAAVEAAAAEATAAASESKSDASSPSSSSSHPVFVDLDKMPSLPTAPALNAYLLGYPVAYSVGDREEAALASRALRAGAGGSGKNGASPTTLALVTLTARALPLPSSSSSSSSASNPSGRAKLCSFSVPLHLWEQATTRRSEGDDEEEEGAKEGSSDGGGDGSESDNASFISLWVESVRASAVAGKTSKKTSTSPTACLFRGEGLKASVKFVDSGGVTM